MQALALYNVPLPPAAALYCRRTDIKVKRPSTLDPRWQLDGERLWSCGAVSYAAWICSLAYAALLQAKSATLALCCQMARCKPAFAELLLPLAFVDLAMNDADCTLSVRMAAAIRRHMLPASAEHPKAVQVLLASLNAVRSRQLDAKMAGGRQQGKGGAAPAAGGAERRSAAALEVIGRWRKVYWLDLDDRLLAETAARSGAYFTAILYLEAWCEEQYRELRLPPPPGERQPAGAGEGAGPDSATAVYRLLLEVYSSINEPDGIYAVARSQDMLSQVRWRAVGGWVGGRVAAALDFMLAGWCSTPPRLAVEVPS